MTVLVLPRMRSKTVKAIGAVAVIIFTLNSYWGYRQRALSVSPEESLQSVQRLLKTRSLDVSSPCFGVQGGIVIPQMYSSIANQRLRMIQDMTAVALMRTNTAIVLPEKIRSRSGCHYGFLCFGAFNRGMPIWKVYSRERMLRTFSDLGFCVIEQREYHAIRTETLLERTSIMASEYEKIDGPTNALARLGPPESCCTNVIPNTKKSEELLTRINAAFQPEPLVRDYAKLVISKLNEIALSKHKSGKFFAMHWGGEEDFMQNHGLDVNKYTQAVKEKLAEMANSGIGMTNTVTRERTVPVILLGVNIPIAALELQFNSYLAKATHPVIKVELYSKETVLGNDVHWWQRKFDDLDDLHRQVDFEIGVRSKIFIGVPYSSFSTLIALMRTDANGKSIRQTYMVAADVDDKMARVLAAQLPYALSDGYPPFGGVSIFQSNRCKALASVNPDWGEDCVA